MNADVSDDIDGQRRTVAAGAVTALHWPGATVTNHPHVASLVRSAHPDLTVREA